MNWMGGIFLAAAVAIAFAVYADANMTRWVPDSFYAVARLCAATKN
jgi:hypothetical protein